MIVVGYGEMETEENKQQPYWLLKNSWGAQVGTAPDLFSPWPFVTTHVVFCMLAGRCMLPGMVGWMIRVHSMAALSCAGCAHPPAMLTMVAAPKSAM